MLLLLLMVGVSASYPASAQPGPDSGRGGREVREPVVRRTPPGTIKIASWNLRSFSDSRTDEQIQTTARILEEYDLIGIQEVEDRDGVDRLVTTLEQQTGRTYGKIVTEKRGGTPAERERYAFIFSKDSIQLLNNGKFNTSSGMTRPPYYASFKTKRGRVDNRFDFSLMLVHTKPRPATALADDLKGAARAFRLTLRTRAEKDLLLAGDFNADPPYVHFRTHLGFLTAIITQAPGGPGSMVRGANLNDNILFGTPTVEDYTKQNGIDQFDVRLFSDASGKVDQATAEGISDHRPVWGGFFNDHDTN
jgi:endonuclease/exonuclease/phosphatase family metal-dependent hydrolase